MIQKTSLHRIPIRDLLLDNENPRFAGNVEASHSQKSLLETIVEKHGVNDLLASMAANGYFSAEPVVAIPNEGKFTVVEGNRRLAAALILTGDPRASQFEDLAHKWASNDRAMNIATLEQLPVSVFEHKDEELIAYLGAKHIRGSKPWDSYAKAHRLFELMSASGLQLTVEAAARSLETRMPIL